MPSNGAAAGSKSATRSSNTIGKTIFSILETSLSWTIFIFLSFSLVIALIIGGWIRGTSAMYEYDATAIAPNSSGARIEATYIEVGPSAPPIIPIAAACLRLKSKTPSTESPTAPNSVAKIPN